MRFLALALFAGFTLGVGIMLCAKALVMMYEGETMAVFLFVVNAVCVTYATRVAIIILKRLINGRDE